MRLERAAGLLAHPTSLPGPGEIGDLGATSLAFLDVLADAGVRVWQMLPLGPTGYGESPYQGFSAFAGNPLLIPPATEPAELADAPPRPVANEASAAEASAADRVDFARARAARTPALAARVARTPRDAAYHAFVHEHAAWLPDYALFMALKARYGGQAWFEWPSPLRHREPAAIAAARRELADAIEARQVEQFLFFAHVRALREAASARGVRLMGDLPIYMAHDSADVWAHPGGFQLDDDGRLRAQAGVPPDYFSADGQLWGNPLYDWDAMAADGFAWWIRRLRAAFALFDIVRLDHFRGFESYWAVPAGEETARNGAWMPGPGDAFFAAARDALGDAPLIAENLGDITPAVEALRTRWALPGMGVLHFAFSPEDDGSAPRLHRFPPETVVYTGTHDNDTTVGWWDALGTATGAAERAFATAYLDAEGREIHWAMIRAALASPCDLAMLPLQDLLGLGSAARMNRPGQRSGNWTWRCPAGRPSAAECGRLRALIETYDR